MPSRKAPGLEPYDFVPFFRALLAAGYDGRVSIEGGLPPPETRVAGLRAALDILRATEAEARRP
jgi:sugar phosphate isomerase/epimerase